MVLVAVLIECDEEVGLVAGREDIAGADADLEDGGPPEIVEGMVM